ncbi:hypothetical protein P154DRAFT_621643 [Amniculicola lignicola CBS 123094]|uniref:Uncharacterized protein n=1 Tax=Amniculicola lignicola CBS 123094 TaxID=1392246 RepID=A0A6A5WCH7_9PLEO|nr:hypothetical protein P154DRAFT_621643 [Amniculicola lignicola CBS 123094]
MPPAQGFITRHVATLPHFIRRTTKRRITTGRIVALVLFSIALVCALIAIVCFVIVMKKRSAKRRQQNLPLQQQSQYKGPTGTQAYRRIADPEAGAHLLAADGQQHHDRAGFQSMELQRDGGFGMQGQQQQAQSFSDLPAYNSAPVGPPPQTHFPQ